MKMKRQNGVESSVIATVLREERAGKTGRGEVRMALQRNRIVLSSGVERVDVRNLLPPAGLPLTSFHLSVELLAVCKDSDGTITNSDTVFRGLPLEYSCNPSWITLAEFNSCPFEGNSAVTDLVVRFYAPSELSSEESMFYESVLDISKLFRMENFSMTTLHSIPSNSIFFWVDEKTVLMENTVYIALRKSKQINARSGSVAIHDDKLGDNLEDVANEGILNEMNSVLMDEDERTVNLLKEIDSGRSMVSNLRKEAETLLHASANNPSTNIDNETNLTLQELELQQLQTLMELAEEEVKAEEALLSKEQQSLLAIQEKLEDSLRKWKVITTEDSKIKTTEDLIDQKKNELIHAKFLLDARRLKLFGELCTIYPIEKVVVVDRSSSSVARSSAASGSISDDDEYYTIRGVELPIVIDGSLRDDEEVSTALGYIVHILLLTSKYLQISLRYEVIYNSSRSMIRDSVLGRGSTLPLFKRGVEKERFDRALIWLQKNVEQLMDRMGYKYSRKSSMLGNLKNLFDCEICPKLIA